MMLRIGLVVAATLLATSSPALGVIYDNYDDLTDGSKYDFVIVGAGAGGAAMANRLTESNSTNVLLVEAGGANTGNITLDIPLLCTRLTPYTQWDWGFNTTAQENLNNRTLPFPRGIGLGGSTAVNCLVYTRGTSQDINKWAEISGDESWGWDAMLPYYKKSEKFNFPVDGHNISGQFDPAYHGFDGYIGVSVPGASRSIDGRVMETTEELSEFPFRLDWNSGEHLGIGWVQALIDRGVRSSSKAYLTDEVLARLNLDILLNSQVSRVLSTTDSTGNETLSFNAIEFRDNTNGEMHNLTASKEIILSAGAVNTPVILMYSGIGPSSTLTPLGIPVLLDNSAVGANLTDHIGVSSTWLVNNTLTLDTVIRNQTIEDAFVEQWKENKTGIMVDTSENHAAWLRVADNSSIWDEYEDPASGNETAHYEFLFQNGLSTVTDSGNYLNIPVGDVSPASKGYITINSSDPFSTPLINPNLLSAPIDIVLVREAIRSSRRFLTAQAWNGYVLKALNTAETDDELDEYIRDNAVSFFHPVATAAMGEYGVVDTSLKVVGVSGLRIVDASVIPRLPAAHTSGPVYAVAEKAADIVKAEYGL